MKNCILYQKGQKSCCHWYRSLSSSMCAKHCRRCFRIACFSKNSSLGTSKIGFWISCLFTIHIFNIPFCDETSQVCGELLNIQLNEYETAPDIIQSSQNMTSNGLFTFLCFPILTWIYLFCTENCSEHQNKTIFSAKQVNSGKNGEKNKSKQKNSCHVLS